MRSPIPTRRPGFTLVEVLVAAALCLLIMTMMTYAFQQAMDTFSLTKSTGDLQERLRAAEIVLRDDLKAPHFFDDQEGGPKVSDQRLDLFDATTGSGWQPRSAGFFRITQESAVNTSSTSSISSASASPYQFEGSDTDSTPSTRATDHVLHMTVRRDGTRLDRAFVATVPTSIWTNSTAYNGTTYGAILTNSTLSNLVPTAGGTQFASEWAEVAYFLEKGTTTTATGMPLFTLYRRVRVLSMKSNTGVDWQAVVGGAGQYPDFQGVSSAPLTPTGTSSTRTLNGPGDVVDPNKRLGGLSGLRFTGTPPPSQFDGLGGLRGSSGLLGDDILLNNVLSFEIKAAWDQNNNTFPTNSTPPWPKNGATATLGQVTPSYFSAPFDDLPISQTNTTLNGANRRVFDTWFQDTAGKWKTPNSASSVPLFIRLKAVQIKIRIYDTKNKLARQITVIQDV